MRRISLSLLAVLLLVFTGWADSSPVFNLGPVNNNLVIGSTQEPSNLNPWEGAADTKENVMALMFLGLTYVDANGDIQPGLATEVPTEANGRVVITTDGDGNFVSQTVDWSIHSDATWSDGVDITCDDAEFTFAVQSREDLPVTTRAFSGRIESVECTSGAGGKDFRITYNQPNLFFSSIGGSIGLARFYDLAPKHIWESIVANVSDPEADFLGAAPATGSVPAQVVGSGAYKFAGRNINQSLTVARRDDFFLNPENAGNYVQEVTVRFITNQPTLLAAILSGEIDASDDIGLAGVDPAVLREQLGSAARVEETASGFIEKLNFNLFTDPNGIGGQYADQVNCQVADDLLLWDKRTRQAIILAIDRESLGPAVFPGAIVSNSFVIAGTSAFNTNLNPWSYDPAAASALLADLGWTLNNSGVLERVTADGRAVTFDLEWVSTTADFRVATGAILQSDLAEVGINLIVRNLPASTVFSSEFLNHGSECTFSGIVEYAEGGGFNEPSDPLTNELWCRDLLGAGPESDPANTPLALNGFGGTNITGWCNDQFDELFASASQEFDADARNAVMQQMQDIYNEELPTAPLYERVEVVTIKNGLLNYAKGSVAARTQFVAPWCWGWSDNGANGNCN